MHPIVCANIHTSSSWLVKGIDNIVWSRKEEPPVVGFGPPTLSVSDQNDISRGYAPKGNVGFNETLYIMYIEFR
jgi:hypothetical protein